MGEDDKGEGKIEFFVPPYIWKGAKGNQGSHAAYRTTTIGKLFNLGPTQPYTNPVTKEVSNQPFKHYPKNPGAYIIPGFYPQGDLASMFITAGAFGLGAIDGVIDDDYVKADVDKTYERIEKEGAYLAAVAANAAKWEEMIQERSKASKKEEKPTSSTRPGRSPSSWFRREIDAMGKGYRVKITGPDGKMDYIQRVNESGDLQEYFEEMNARNAKSLTFEAIGDDGKLSFHEGYQSIS